MRVLLVAVLVWLVVGLVGVGLWAGAGTSVARLSRIETPSGAPYELSDCVTTSTTAAGPDYCGNSDSDTEAFVSTWDSEVLPDLAVCWLLLVVPLLGMALLLHFGRRASVGE